MIDPIANRTAGEIEKNVLQIRQDGAEVGDANPILAETMNHFGHQIVPAAANRELRVVTYDILHARDRAKAIDDVLAVVIGVRFGGQHHGALRAVTLYEILRRVDVDDASMLEDGDTIAQAFGFFHQVRGQENRFAALADPAHQIPDRAARLRVEAGGQFVEEDYLGIVNQRQRNEESLLLAAREIHEPGIPLVDQAQLVEQPFAVDCFSVIERGPEVDGFPNFDPLLQLRLLELHTDAVLQLVNVLEGIQAQHRDDAAVGRAQTLDAFHRGGFSRAVGTDQAKNLAVVHVERHVVDRQHVSSERAVGFADAGNLDDGRHECRPTTRTQVSAPITRCARTCLAADCIRDTIRHGRDLHRPRLDRWSSHSQALLSSSAPSILNNRLKKQEHHPFQRCLVEYDNQLQQRLDAASAGARCDRRHRRRAVGRDAVPRSAGIPLGDVLALAATEPRAASATRGRW